jgi:hypothetical protein
MLAMWALCGLAAAGEPAKFLLVSSTTRNSVDFYTLRKAASSTPLYSMIMGYTSNAPSLRQAPITLLDQQVKMPRGLAIDRFNCEGGACERRLYVADLGKQSILAFNLMIANGVPAVGPVEEDGPSVCAITRGLLATWVTVDSDGNLYFNAGKDGAKQISMIPGEQLRGSKCTRPEPRVIYDGASAEEVDAPGGLATDNFKLFWTNKAMGSQIGAVVSAPTDVEVKTDLEADDDVTPAPPARTKVVINVNSVYGVCLAMNNLYYTSENTYVYGVKKTGGAIATISDKFLAPRGCAFDGDGTVYVMDTQMGAILNFPSNMGILAPSKVKKFAMYGGGFGAAVMTADS